MNRDEFLVKLKDILETEEELTFETVLNDLEEWDSLSKMAVIAFFDEDFNIKLIFNDFQEISTIDDLAKKAGI